MEQDKLNKDIIVKWTAADVQAWIANSIFKEFTDRFIYSDGVTFLKYDATSLQELEIPRTAAVPLSTLIATWNKRPETQETRTLPDVKVLTWWTNCSKFKTVNEILESSSGHPFGASTIVERKCYKQLFKKIYPTGNLRTLISGNPGIGKSCFLVYLLLKLAIEEDKTVVYRNRYFLPEANAYCFKKTGVRVSTNEDIFISELRKPDTWYLVDTIPNPGIFDAHTVMVASPHPDNTKHFKKYGEISVYYMSAWSSDEIFQLNKHVFKIDETIIEEYFKQLGGIPRFLFVNPEQHIIIQQQNMTMDNIEACINHIGKSSGDIASHHLIQIVPTADLKNFYIDFLSLGVANEIIQKWKEEAHDKFLSFLKYAKLPQYSIIRGRAFEDYAHIILSAGGTFQVRLLTYAGLKQSEELNLKQRKTHIVEGTDIVWNNNEDSYYKPSNPNFPVVDSWAQEGFFQITINEDHPLNAIHLDKFLNTVESSQFPIKRIVYFVVPEDQFANYKIQRLTRTDTSSASASASTSRTISQDKKRKTIAEPEPQPQPQQRRIDEYTTPKGSGQSSPTKPRSRSSSPLKVIRNAPIIEQWVLAISINPKDKLQSSQYQIKKGET